MHKCTCIKILALGNIVQFSLVENIPTPCCDFYSLLSYFYTMFNCKLPYLSQERPSGHIEVFPKHIICMCPTTFFIVPGILSLPHLCCELPSSCEVQPSSKISRKASLGTAFFLACPPAKICKACYLYYIHLVLIFISYSACPVLLTGLI